MSDMRVAFYEDMEAFYHELSRSRDLPAFHSPFQYQAWQKNLYREHLAIRKRYPYVGALLFREDTAILGGHFFVKSTGKQRGIFLLGSGGETDYYDLLYFSAEVADQHIEYFLNQVANHMKEYRFSFAQIPDESPLSAWARGKGIAPYFTNECAWIHLADPYEGYLASLSKSVRQNLRTAANRLEKDAHTASIHIFDEEEIPPEESAAILSLYEARRRVKNSGRGIAQIKYWIREQIRKHNKKKYHVIAEALRCMEGKFLATYKIDGVLAAYCFGLKSQNNDRICIMQVAINDEYGKYSPGMLLLTGVFRHILQGREEQAIVFDLTNGNEKYKYSLGATPHYTNYYRFCLTEESS